MSEGRTDCEAYNEVRALTEHVDPLGAPLSPVTGCTYLELFDAGAGIIGEALCVRDLDVLPVQNPSQVVPHLWTETNQELG